MLPPAPPLLAALLAALLLVHTTAGAALYTAPPTLCPAPPKLAPGTLRPDAVTVAFEGTVAVTGDATFEGIEGSVESGLADGADGRVFTVDAVLPVGAGIPAECYELVLFVGELEDDEATLPAGAGSLCAGHGGHVVVAGTPKEIIDCDDSLTGRYLTMYQSLKC